MEMELKALRPYIPALADDKRYYLIAGGRAGGRSYFASQYATASLTSKGYSRIAIMRLVQGDIRNSIYQEIIDRLEEQEYIDEVKTTTKPISITYGSNIINGLGFKKSSGDQKAKLKSLAGYTDVIIEEAEEIGEEDFNQLDDSLRTIKAKIRIILLFNMPPKNHWINKRWFNLIDSGIDGFYKAELKDSEKHNTCYIHTTFKDNLINLNETTIDNFKRYEQTNPEHYWNMIQGLVPSGKRGVIFKNWQPITVKEYEELPYNVFYGLDYGFTSDPCTLIEIKMHNDNVYVRRIIYEVGLLNKNLSEKMKQLKISNSKEIIPDSAEPKSNAEMKSYGWNIIPAEKGPDSVRNGINILLGKNFFYTEDSIEIAEEIQNYTWAVDKNKEPTNEPIDDWNHCIDAIRYAVTYQLSKKRPNIRLL